MILLDQPLIAQFDSLIDDQRIDQLLTMDDYVRSRGYSHDSDQSDLVKDRTSLTLFDYEDQLKDVRLAMLDRIKAETGRCYDLAQAELLQLTRYRVGQEYRPHYDHFNIVGYENNTAIDRCATALLYLNDGFGGGETHFPLINVTVYPRRGDILYFEYPPELAELMLHAGLPVTQGEKRIASLWIRSAVFDSLD